jgi:uncharacterized protein (TIGR00369 family)
MSAPEPQDDPGGPTAPGRQGREPTVGGARGPRFGEGADGVGVVSYLRFDREEIPAAEGEPYPSFVSRAPVDPHLTQAGGRLHTGVLLTLVDIIGGLTGGMAALPDWVMTTSLVGQMGLARHVGPLRFEARVLRRGRRSVIAAVDVHDEGADDAWAGSCLLTSACMATATPPSFPRPVRTLMSEAEPVTQPVEEFFGILPGDGPVARLELDQRLLNPWGVLHGGAACVLVDVAASRAVAAVGTGAAVAADEALQFLNPIRVGPAEARAVIVGSRADGHLLRVSVHDVGAGDRLCGLATVTLRPIRGTSP